jgi:DNA-binding NarL/FixJ family response regulator
LTRARAAARGRWPREAQALGALIILLSATAVFFLVDSLMDLAAESPGELPHNLAEFMAVILLAACIVLLSREVRRMLRRHAHVETQLQAARGAFSEIMERHFAEWGLTPSERDVALLSIKGLPIAEIAAARSTREGTVKAQLNAIYSKAGVANRTQLVGVFIDEIIDAPLPKDEN